MVVPLGAQVVVQVAQVVVRAVQVAQADPVVVLNAVAVKANVVVANAKNFSPKSCRPIHRPTLQSQKARLSSSAAPRPRPLARS